MAKEKLLWVRNGEIGYSENGNPYAIRVPEMRTTAVFKPIEMELIVKLMDFARYRSNIGKTICIEGVEYELKHVSMKKNFRTKSRSLSVYFLVGKSVIRISDHWSETKNHPRSKKLNCGQIDSAWWELDDKDRETLEFKGLESGKYPWVLKGGICGKTVLNKTVDHWKK